MLKQRRDILAYRFTSLRHPIDRLVEAEFFLNQMKGKPLPEFGYFLNAFLSASRSVTFVLQQSMSPVLGFDSWYDEQRNSYLTQDRAMKFFLELRNVSQKQGPVGIIGGRNRDGYWTYRFVAQNDHKPAQKVPEELLAQDIERSGVHHLSKLAKLLLNCFYAFPLESCPARALSVDGMQKLGYSIDDVLESIGLPSGWIAPEEKDVSRALNLLQREFHYVDETILIRLSKEQPSNYKSPAPSKTASNNPVLDYIAVQLSDKSAKLPDRIESILGQAFLQSQLKNRPQ